MRPTVLLLVSLVGVALLLTTCGPSDPPAEELPDGPLHWSAVAPTLYYDVPPEEREERCRLLEETCVILGAGDDGEDVYCLLGDLHIEVAGLADPLVLSNWVSVTEETFRETRELWHEPDILEKKYFGWFYNGYSAFEPKTTLKANIEFTQVGTRPRIVLQPTDHPLSVASYEGITRTRLGEVAIEMAQDHVRMLEAEGIGTGETR